MNAWRFSGCNEQLSDDGQRWRTAGHLHGGTSALSLGKQEYERVGAHNRQTVVPARGESPDSEQ